MGFLHLAILSFFTQSRVHAKHFLVETEDSPDDKPVRLNRKGYGSEEGYGEPTTSSWHAPTTTTKWTTTTTTWTTTTTTTTTTTWTTTPYPSTTRWTEPPPT